MSDGDDAGPDADAGASLDVTPDYWQTQVTGLAAPPPVGGGDDAVSDGDAVLQAEKDKRGGVKKGKNGMKACNWWVGDADWGHYCGKAVGYSADKTTGLFRCIDHGGNADRIKAATHNSGQRNGGSGGCKWAGGCDKRSLGFGDHKGFPFCTTHRKLLKPKVEAVHGKDFVPPKGFDFAPFYPPPPPSAGSSADHAAA